MYDPELIDAAKRYVEVIRQIEQTSDPVKLRRLEHDRVDLHWDFIDALKKNGVKFRDRNHATEIALRIARTS
jgi:hypothetical protein